MLIRMRSAAALTFIASEHVHPGQRGGVPATMVTGFSGIVMLIF